jgi:hypothetical protein
MVYSTRFIGAKTRQPLRNEGSAVPAIRRSEWMNSGCGRSADFEISGHHNIRKTLVFLPFLLLSIVARQMPENHS